jgi:hypothetical protein
MKNLLTKYSPFKIFFARMKNFMTKKKLFGRHCVIVGSLILKETKTLATNWEVNYYFDGIINWSFPM